MSDKGNVLSQDNGAYVISHFLTCVSTQMHFHYLMYYLLFWRFDYQKE